jgi:uncharacterized protein YbaR (Trm112 family)
MFIEITEYLKCPANHAAAWLVLAPERLEQRHVVTGMVGCPVCKSEYAIRDRVVQFGTAPAWSGAAHVPGAATVQALIGLESPGGVVVLVGSAADVATELATLMPGVHLIVVNAERPAPGTSPVESASGLPLRDRMARGVVLGGEAVDWVAEARRVVLPGQRVVVLRDAVPVVEGLEALASGDGLWVGRRR